jgi:hypothetical protein
MYELDKTRNDEGQIPTLRNRLEAVLRGLKESLVILIEITGLEPEYGGPWEEGKGAIREAEMMAAVAGEMVADVVRRLQWLAKSI